jgi:hypothetical protein
MIKGNKITAPQDNVEYVFKATFNRAAKGDEWKRLLWMKKINGLSFFYFPVQSTISKDNMQVQAKITCDQMRLYAYFARPVDSVSVEVTYKKVVVFFIGGAGDKEPFFGNPATFIVRDDVRKVFYDNNIKGTTIDKFYISDYLGYYEVKGEDQVRKNVLAKIPDKTFPVYIVGHSLGGWNGAHLAQILSDKGYNVETLVTLDPVGTGNVIGVSADIYWGYPTPYRKCSYWINILTNPDSWKIDDYVAWGGGQWVPAKKNTDIFHITKYHHGEAGKMFTETIENGLSASDILLNSIKQFLNQL